MIVHQDCRYFKGEIPCRLHKEHGVHCDGCAYYDKIEFRILIIKLDAPGDVLRTTCILQGLKASYANCHITWLTRKECLPFFANNPCVDIVLEYSADSFVHILSETYDLVINADASPAGARLATMVEGRENKGFLYHRRGYVFPVDENAQMWFEMGLFDDIKKGNSETYQKIILDIVGIRPSSYNIIFNLDEAEKAFAVRFGEKYGVAEEDLVIGLNTGAGARWQNKKWTLEGYLGLIRLIKKELEGCKILLYGGLEEIQRNRYLMERENGLIDTGCGNTLREFGALLDLCDVLVTGDTMALHITVALRKKVIALFGPTSQAEVDLYGKGKKVFANVDCLCCYRPTCDIRPSCMDMITPQQVFSAIKEVI